jgi:hypothetical protein
MRTSPNSTHPLELPLRGSTPVCNSIWPMNPMAFAVLMEPEHALAPPRTTVTKNLVLTRDPIYLVAATPEGFGLVLGEAYDTILCFGMSRL